MPKQPQYRKNAQLVHTVNVSFGDKSKGGQKDFRVATTHNVQNIKVSGNKSMSVTYDVNKSGKRYKTINYNGTLVQQFIKKLKTTSSVGQLINNMLGNASHKPTSGIKKMRSSVITSHNQGFLKFIGKFKNTRQDALKFGPNMNDFLKRMGGVVPFKKQAPISQTKNAHNEMQKYISGGKK